MFILGNAGSYFIKNGNGQFLLRCISRLISGHQDHSILSNMTAIEVQVTCALHHVIPAICIGSEDKQSWGYRITNLLIWTDTFGTILIGNARCHRVITTIRQVG